MPVTVTFCINTSSDACVSEDELATDLERHRVAILADEERHGVMNGALIVRAPGVPDVRIEDEIEYLVHQICFLAIPDLLANKHIVVRHFRYLGYVRLDPEAMQQLISGDDIPSARVTYHELVPALVACGERFILFLRRLNGGTPEGEDRVQLLERNAAIACEAIQAIGGEIKPRFVS